MVIRHWWLVISHNGIKLRLSDTLTQSLSLNTAQFLSIFDSR